ncbi:sporulation phosphorelay system protein KapB [Cohnella suwonensis]|uniref:Sporulation phosphorelay system protein KapB n=1 Tax=Cohnella suwonensis TaxID=696072 RepID=A0ABW0M2B9_9BACL
MKPIESASQLVRISYKTGEYVGEAVDGDDRRILVKVLAVLRHPTQGDLHSEFDPDAAIFHERKALSYTEKAWVPAQTVKPYGGALPDYRESLKAALEAEVARIDRLRRWSEKCLEKLGEARKDYGM